MSRNLTMLVFFLSLTPTVHAERPAPLSALKGLDPLELLAGREVLGKKENVFLHGRFHYLFSTRENLEKFKANPGEYGIQMGGGCGRMGPLSGMGDPNRFFIHKGRIYIFASEECRKAFSANPEKFLERPMPSLRGDNKAEQRGKELLQLALKGMGGEKEIDKVKNFQILYRQTYKYKEGEVLGWREWTIDFPGKIRRRERFGNWQGGNVVLAKGGFRFEDKFAWELTEEVRETILREVSHQPLFLLRLRKEPGFQAIAAGSAHVGDIHLEYLKVHLHGSTTTLALDPKSGKIVQIAYLGRFQGKITKMAEAFFDFREVEGLILPHGVEFFAEARRVENPTTQIEAITINSHLNPELFQMPD